MYERDAQCTKGTHAPSPIDVDEPQAALETPCGEERGLELVGWGCLGVLMLGVAGVGLVVALMPSYGPSDIWVTESRAHTIRQAITLFRVENPDECPSVTQLVEGQYLNGTSDSEDSWGMSFRLVCDGREVRVYSAGPDGSFDTADDVNR